MKSRTKGIVVAGVAVLVVAAVTAAVVLLVLPRLNTQAPKKVEVSQEQASPEQPEPTNTVELVGTVKKTQSFEPVGIVADTAGIVQGIAVTEGQEVSEGDVLYTVQYTVSTDNSASVEAAQARLAAAQSAYAEAKATYDSVMDSYDWAYNNYEEAHAQWEFEHDMWLMQMYAYEEAVADAEWRRENAPDDWDEYGNPVAYIHYEWPGEEPVEPVLASELGTAQAQADEQLSAAAYEVEAAQAQLNEATASSTVSTETREVRAPASGKVASLRVEDGMAVSADDSEPLLTVEAVSEASVEATVEEGDGNDLTLGGNITVTFPQVEGLELSASVKSASDSKVELALLGDDERVQDGMEARASVPVQKKEGAAELENQGESEDKGESEGQTQSEDKDQADDKSESNGAQQGAAVDVNTVDYDVAAMADDEAFQFMHDFTNRTPDKHAEDFGKVLHIKGVTKRYAKIEDDQEKVSYSIGVKGEGGVIWAVNFYVEGWSADDYPQNGTTAEVTGVYGEVEDYGTNAGKTLICNAADVKLIEE